MKKRLLILMTVTGMIILLGGLLTYGLGVHEIIPVPRPDLIVVGTSLIGILLIVSGVCDLFVKKTKEMEIEENDERNISLSNAAMASGFKVMNVTIAVSIFALIFTGYMTVVPCFTIIGAYAIGQIVFIVRICHNGLQAHKRFAGLAVALCFQYSQGSEGKCSFRRLLSCGFHFCLSALLLWLARKLQSHTKVLVFLP